MSSFRKGQPVWDTDRKQPNGYICDIHWQERQLVVKFHDGEYEIYDFDEVEHTWTDKFNGGWDLR